MPICDPLVTCQYGALARPTGALLPWIHQPYFPEWITNETNRSPCPGAGPRAAERPRPAPRHPTAPGTGRPRRSGREGRGGLPSTARARLPLPRRPALHPAGDRGRRAALLCPRGFQRKDPPALLVSGGEQAPWEGGGLQLW